MSFNAKSTVEKNFEFSTSDGSNDKQNYIELYRDSLLDYESPEKELNSYFKTHIEVNRNKGKAKRIDKLLRNEPNHCYFFAFGAAHFLGEESVVGYKVTRVE